MADCKLQIRSHKYRYPSAFTWFFMSERNLPRIILTDSERLLDGSSIFAYFTDYQFSTILEMQSLSSRRSGVGQAYQLSPGKYLSMIYFICPTGFLFSASSSTCSFTTTALSSFGTYEISFILLSLDVWFLYVCTGLDNSSMICRKDTQSFALPHLFSFSLSFSSTNLQIFIFHCLMTLIRFYKFGANLLLQLLTSKMNTQTAYGKLFNGSSTSKPDFDEDEVIQSQEGSYSEDSVQYENQGDWFLQNYQACKKEQNQDTSNCQSKGGEKRDSLDGTDLVIPHSVESSQEKKENLAQKKSKDQNLNGSSTVNQKIKKVQKNVRKGEMKSKTFTYDSKIIHSVYELLQDDFKLLMNSGDGFIKVNPYQDSKTVTIFYYDEQKLKDTKNKLDESIMEIEMLPMNKILATSGLQLSLKLNEKMKKQKMSFFNDTTQKFKTPSYYLCGRVEVDELQKMMDEIRQIKFTYLSLFKYQNTRSYRAIVAKIFGLPPTHSYVVQKFQAKQIEIACLKKNFQMPDESNPFLLLTFQRSRKMLSHQAIENSIYEYIDQTYATFCFCFLRRKDLLKPKYIPKIDNVEWFFIAQKKIKAPISYLFIIVQRTEWIKVKAAIIEVIKSIKLDIVSRRFFRNIHPTREETIQTQKCRVFSYPKNHPYSWVYSAEKGEKFDWIEQLKL